MATLGRRWISHWEPNDPAFWSSTGRAIARRNLAFSIFAEFLGFSVWNLWSVVAARLDLVGFHYSIGEVFWLVGLPVLVGSVLRIPYGAVVPLVGGRNWTIASALLLLVPTIVLAVLVQHPGTPFWLMAVGACTAGFGGGNFASSMSNISHFYPDDRKGWALGLNAAGGNIGVAVVQFVVPAVIGAGILGLVLAPALKKATAAAARLHTPVGAQLAQQGLHLQLQNAGLIWVPLIVVAALCALLFMDNLKVAQAPLREQAAVLGRRHTWIMSVLYVGTFGSFIGYSAAFPTLISSQFPAVNFLEFAFLGPLVGSVARPLGGWLADRVGGTVVTFWNFALMAAAAIGVVIVLNGHNPKTSPASFGAFLAVFLLLFLTSGIGNGSTYRMIPQIFLNDRLRAIDPADSEALAGAGRQGRKESAAAISFISALGAFGGFFIPIGFAQSLGAAHGVAPALEGFVAFYVVGLGITYGVYMRSGHESAVARGAVAPRRLEASGRLIS